MKKIIAVLLALVLVFSFAACGGNGENSNTEKQKITVCLDYTPNTNHTGLYVALQKGYYDEAGLDVTIVQPPEDGSVLMCASGQAQFAIKEQDGLAATFASDDPLGVTAVAAILQHNTSGIMSRKGDGITSPKGLEGKTYSTWDSPIEQAMIKYVMEKDGGDFSKVNLIPYNVTSDVDAIANKDTDAIWVFYGWAGIQAEVENIPMDYFDFASMDSVLDFYTPVIIANNDYLESNPDTAKAFLEATSKGYNFAVQNPEEAAELLISGDTTGSLKDSKELVVASQKWLSEQYIADAEKWGVFDAERWDGFYAWLWENKLIEKEIKPGTGFTNDYLPS
ncbi:MAG: ABC transporter substrate-binding protein [Acutalibacteraceae bacterium]